jgi:hypothetical protein
VSNERYPASSFKSIVVFDALATTVDLQVLGQMQVFIIISLKVDFIRKTMYVSLHMLIRASIGSFPAAFVALSRNREYPDTFLHSAEVITCTYKRSKPCCTTGRTFPSILPWYGAQFCDPSESLSFSATSHTHPFVVPTLETIHAGLLPLGSPDLD